MSVKEKSFGEILDSLITTSIRCWMAQEIIMDENRSEAERLQGAITAQKSNKKRNELIRAIDEIMGMSDRSPDEKSY